LTGSRIVLRAYTPTDAPSVWAAISESRSSLVRWTPDIGRRVSLADVQTGLERLDQACARGERLVYGVWRRDVGAFLGEVGLHDIDWDRRAASVGYWLRVSARGQGLIDEALEVLQAHASRVLGLRDLEAHIAAENAASRRVVERHGYLLKGARCADARWDGEASRVLIYALTLDQAGAT
jgi:ribosomal-protein-serine acetyltransferase